MQNLELYIRKSHCKRILKPSIGWKMIKGWQLTKWILLLSAELLKVEDCEVSTS